MPVSESVLADLYPRLYHMAERGSWPSICQHGLLSTSALLDLYEVDGEQRAQLEAAHRPESVEISHPRHGRAVIRDQKPMDDRGLRRALTDGLTPAEWYRILNDKVFFWLTEKRLNTLLGARAYRKLRHDVLVVDTRKLLSKHAQRVVLSPMNSGATKPMPFKRGRSTFLAMDEYPFDERKSSGKDPVAELAVRGSVPDISNFVIRVYEAGAGAPPVTLWEP